MVAWTPNPTLTLIGIPNRMHLVSPYKTCHPKPLAQNQGVTPLETNAVVDIDMEEDSRNAKN